MGHPVADAARALFDDADATIKRIRGDVDHLRAVGRRAKVGASMAARAAKKTLEHAVDEAASRLSRAFDGPRPRGR